MSFKYKFSLFFVVWFIFISFIFNKYAYEIDQFNAATRVLIKHGTFEVRSFDKKGIPHSKSAKYKDGFISPFYVVHYGLLYSLEYVDQFDGVHWGFNKTHHLWNVPPKKIENQYFKNTADWVVENLKKHNGHYHLLYDFDWYYKGYPNGKLVAPWYSGLTDGYAIILMLRAYDVYKDEKYLEVAKKLYQSVLAKYEDGGSLTELEGEPWIEEYVQPGLNSNQMAFVLNGMVYSYYGVVAYENLINREQYSNILLNSIITNLERFGHSYWSQYDLIGNAANIKYHRIHVGLLEELIDTASMSTTQKLKVNEVYEKWKVGQENAGVFWFLNANLTHGYFHFYMMWIFVLLIPVIITVYIKLKRKE